MEGPQEDSVKKLPIDRFWIKLAIALVILAVVWVSLLLPKLAQRSRLHTQNQLKAQELERAVAGTPSRKDVLDWARYKAKLVQDQAAISAFYSDHGKALRAWFPKLPLGPDGLPPRDSFVSRYQDEAQALEKALTQHAPPVTVGEPGFHWEDLSIAHWDGVGRDNEKLVMRELQKRYRARLRVAQLALGGRVPLQRLVDVRFFKRLHEKFPEGNPQPGEIPPAQWPGLSAPSDPDRSFRFGFAVELPYSQVPRALHELVSPGPDGLLLSVLGTHVTIREQNPPKVEFLYEEGNEAQKEALRKAIEASSKPRSVILTVTCQIVDTEPKELTSR